MAAEIETPGKGQLRALIVSAGNPVLSVPGSTGLERALGKLDLQVGIDLYLNETHKYADYVLPAATFLERDDLVIAALDFHLKPFVQWTEAVVPPRGEARPDWEIIDALARELGFAARVRAGHQALRDRYGWAGSPCAPSLRRAGRVTPALLIDLLLRTGRDGDRFGLRRGGLSLSQAQGQPARRRARRAPRGRDAQAPGVPPRPQGPARRRRDRARARPAARQPAARRRVPAAAHRPARRALPQLVDAQHARSTATPNAGSWRWSIPRTPPTSASPTASWCG